MKNLWKSALTIMVAIALFIMFPTQAQAKELWENEGWTEDLWKEAKKTQDGYTYAEYKGEIYILSYNVGTIDGNEMLIPETIERKPVVAFAIVGGLDDVFQKVVIPKYLEYFELQILGSESVVPHEYVVSEGNQHFKIVDGILYSMDGKELVACPQKNELIRISVGVKKIKEYAFAGNDVKKIIMPDTVEVIAERAFWESGIQNINLSKNLKEIGKEAFYNSSLRKISLPSKLKEIGTYAFCDTSIKTIKIPKSVTTIGKNAFEGCLSLEKVTFEAGSKVKVLEEGVFSNCLVLEEIKLPSKLKKINAKAFYRCMYLRTIKIPATVTKIADNAFVSKGKRRSLTIKAKKNSYAYRYAKNRKNRRIKAVAI